MIRHDVRKRSIHAFDLLLLYNLPPILRQRLLARERRLRARCSYARHVAVVALIKMQAECRRWGSQLSICLYLYQHIIYLDKHFRPALMGITPLPTPTFYPGSLPYTASLTDH